MDTSLLYNQFITEFKQANNYQTQISQKEFESKLIDINLQYGNNGNDWNTQNLVQQNNIRISIHTIEAQRDNYITKAIVTAIQLADYELSNSKNIVFSMAYVAFNSINSFISSYNIKLNLSLFIISKIAQISKRLILESNLSFIVSIR